MKVPTIEWQLFWQAWRQQNSSGRCEWLGRWVFADSGVSLSRRPARCE